MKSKLFFLALAVIALVVFGGRGISAESGNHCTDAYDCIGMVIDSGDPVLIQMGHEMSDMVTTGDAGTFVKPTAGPIANVARLMSRENAGLSVVPSDMLLYTERSGDPKLQRADNHLRFIMTIGEKVVHVIARKDIQRLEDLDGKRVVMGPDNTAIWVVSNNLLNLHGATPSERIQMKPPEGITAVLLGQADAVFAVGGAPLGPVSKLAEMRRSEEFRAEAENVHMLEIKVPAAVTEYRPVTVDYPGFAESTETVAILPTLVSYDFTAKKSAYFRRRCSELARIGTSVRDRLEELRQSGHQQWRATTWELEAGNWQKDDCFFGTASPENLDSSVLIASSSRPYRVGEDVFEAQRILNGLGYDSGPVDGILGPLTAAALTRFQHDQGLTIDGQLTEDVLSKLRGVRISSR